MNKKYRDRFVYIKYFQPNFVKFNSVNPLTIFEYFICGISSHPQRRALPVVVPNSAPTCPRCSPTLSFNSVGNGPSPTRVQ